MGKNHFSQVKNLVKFLAGKISSNFWPRLQSCINYSVVVSAEAAPPEVAPPEPEALSDSAFPDSWAEAAALTRLGSIMILAKPFRLFLQPPRH